MTTAIFTASDIISAFDRSDHPAKVMGFYQSKARAQIDSLSPTDFLSLQERGLLTDDDLAGVETNGKTITNGNGNGKAKATTNGTTKAKAKAKKPTKRERLGVPDTGFFVTLDVEVTEKCSGTPMFAVYLDGASLKTMSGRVLAGIVTSGPAGLKTMTAALKSAGVMDNTDN